MTQFGSKAPSVLEPPCLPTPLQFFWWRRKIFLGYADQDTR